MVVEEETEMCHILNNNENQCVLYILFNTLQRSMDCQVVLCVWLSVQCNMDVR